MQETNYSAAYIWEDVAHVQGFQQLVQETKLLFYKTVERYLWFHLFFIALFVTFISFVAVFFAALSDLFLIGLTVSLFFFLVLIYFVLKLYFQQEKPERLRFILNNFIKKCAQEIQYNDSHTVNYTQIASSCMYMACRIFDSVIEEMFSSNFWKYILKLRPKIFDVFIMLDVHRMQELFLQKAIQEYIKIVQMNPTTFDSHVGLANAYTLLSEQYTELIRDVRLRTLYFQKYLTVIQERFSKVVKAAIQEFTILKEYAPQDVWVHKQLAKRYHSLHMIEKEIEEYEALRGLAPYDEEALFTLGLLYFKTTKFTQGLNVYEQLKSLNKGLAEKLIQHYGAYTLETEDL